MTPWQDIESAPKLEPELLLYVPSEGRVIGFYVSSRDFTGWTTGWVTSGGYDIGYSQIKPTHWALLPTPPVEGEDGLSGASLPAHASSEAATETLSDLERELLEALKLIAGQTPHNQTQRSDPDREHYLRTVLIGIAARAVAKAEPRS